MESMNIRTAYNTWSEQYDTNANRTRDMEAKVLREVLKEVVFTRVLEIGCGTGKNTEWLAERAAHITAVDLSEGMLAKAREKITTAKVHFMQADILRSWDFRDGLYDLVTFSLVLEHVEHLEPMLKEAAASLPPGGHVYIGELHPFKQYAGTKARFETEQGTHVVTCHGHHLSEFLQAAGANDLQLVHLGEHFDEDDRTTPPRILSLLLRKRPGRS
jgi:ubiquinone/menaquinone biosynthesis C-methylase UbiE